MATLGERIHKARRQAGLTIASLAKATGFSQSYISQVERSLANPSVAALKKIADALGVQAGSFFEAELPQSNDSQHHIRRNQRKGLVYPGSNIKHELLTPDLKRQLEILWVTSPVGTDSGPYPFSHHGEECMIIIKGRMELLVGGERYVLEEGDSFYFEASLPHRWQNVGDGELHAVAVMTPPSF